MGIPYSHTMDSMDTLQKLVLVVILATSHISYVQSKSSNRQMTVMIEPGDDYCFFVPNITTGQNFEFDFQVTESTGAEGINDITCRLSSPKPEAKLVYEAVKESEGSHNEEAHMDGDYEICFDNRMSTWAEKVVWFEVTVHDPEDDYYDDYIESEEWNEIKDRNEDTENLYDMASNDLKNYIHTIRLSMGKIKHYQFMQGADMSRDHHNVLRMTERLDLWSFMHLSIMLVIGFTQIYMVRQLFEEKSFWHKFRR